MKRRDYRVGMRAVIVESIGAIVLLYLFLPDAGEPVSVEVSSVLPVSAPVSAVDGDQMLPGLGADWVTRSPGEIPLLQLPAPPGSAGSAGPASVNNGKESEADRERSEFVARELDGSRRVLVELIKRHVQSIVEPPEVAR